MQKRSLVIRYFCYFFFVKDAVPRCHNTGELNLANGQHCGSSNTFLKPSFDVEWQGDNSTRAFCAFKSVGQGLEAVGLEPGSLRLRIRLCRLENRVRNAVKRQRAHLHMRRAIAGTKGEENKCMLWRERGGEKVGQSWAVQPPPSLKLCVPLPLEREFGGAFIQRHYVRRPSRS